MVVEGELQGVRYWYDKVEDGKRENKGRRRRMIVDGGWKKMTEREGKQPGRWLGKKEGGLMRRVRDLGI